MQRGHWGKWIGRLRDLRRVRYGQFFTPDKPAGLDWLFYIIQDLPNLNKGYKVGGRKG